MGQKSQEMAVGRTEWSLRREEKAEMLLCGAAEEFCQVNALGEVFQLIVELHQQNLRFPLMSTLVCLLML